MKHLLRSGAAALAIAGLVQFAGSAQAQTPPQVWDGVVVPTDATECIPDSPIAWRATYRPYISDLVSGVSQPSQLVVFSRGGRNATGLRLANTGAGQFNGNIDKPAIPFFVATDLDDKDTQSNAGGGSGAPGRTIHLLQSPATVGAANTLANRFIKITGTIVLTSGGGAGLNCATHISGVFVRRPM